MYQIKITLIYHIVTLVPASSRIKTMNRFPDIVEEKMSSAKMDMKKRKVF